MTDYSKLPDTMLPQVKQQITQRIAALETALTAQRNAFNEAIAIIESSITEAETELKQINARLK